MKNNISAIRLFIGMACMVSIAFMLGSCGNLRRLTYMQGKFDTAQLSKVQSNYPVIQNGDLLSIIVYSDNPQATALYNQSVVQGATGSGSGATSAGSEGISPGLASGASPAAPGYLVDDGGNIEFQGLGKLHVAGLTRGLLRDLLDSKLKEFLVHPYYTIRFLNYRFTILGEVNRPGIYSIPGERLSVLEALGLAGDMTFYGRRDNVLIIRQNRDTREFCRLDFTKPDIMGSPYFFLQQNDVMVVEAVKQRVSASDQVTARNITIAATVASTIAIIYSIFR
jgi:polysaccharide export outer membrane protein